MVILSQVFYIMPFCLHCGQPATHSIPKGDSRVRIICFSCGYIHYDNPKMVCGTLAITKNKILLCRRAIEPRLGFWTLPAGFMEIGETMEQGAVRETYEEADAHALNPKLYCLFDLPHVGQIHAMYLTTLKDGHYGVGSESLECRLFDPTQIPWERLSFRTVEQTLRLYLQDYSTLTQTGLDTTQFDNYPLHRVVIPPHKQETTD